MPSYHPPALLLFPITTLTPSPSPFPPFQLRHRRPLPLPPQLPRYRAGPATVSFASLPLQPSADLSLYDTIAEWEAACKKAGERSSETVMVYVASVFSYTGATATVTSRLHLRHPYPTDLPTPYIATPVSVCGFTFVGAVAAAAAVGALALAFGFEHVHDDTAVSTDDALGRPVSASRSAAGSCSAELDQSCAGRAPSKLRRQLRRAQRCLHQRRPSKRLRPRKQQKFTGSIC